MRNQLQGILRKPHHTPIPNVKKVKFIVPSTPSKRHILSTPTECHCAILATVRHSKSLMACAPIERPSATTTAVSATPATASHSKKLPSTTFSRTHEVAVPTAPPPALKIRSSKAIQHRYTMILSIKFMIPHTNKPSDALPMALGNFMSALQVHDASARLLHLFNDDVQFNTLAQLPVLSELYDQVVYFDGLPLSKLDAFRRPSRPSHCRTFPATVRIGTNTDTTHLLELPSLVLDWGSGIKQVEIKRIQEIRTVTPYFLVAVPTSGDPASMTEKVSNFLSLALETARELYPTRYSNIRNVPEFAMRRDFVHNIPYNQSASLIWKTEVRKHKPWHIECKKGDYYNLKAIIDSVGATDRSMERICGGWPGAFICDNFDDPKPCLYEVSQLEGALHRHVWAMKRMEEMTTMGTTIAASPPNNHISSHTTSTPNDSVDNTKTEGNPHNNPTTSNPSAIPSDVKSIATTTSLNASQDGTTTTATASPSANPSSSTSTFTPSASQDGTTIERSNTYANQLWCKNDNTAATIIQHAYIKYVNRKSNHHLHIELDNNTTYQDRCNELRSDNKCSTSASSASQDGTTTTRPSANPTSSTSSSSSSPTPSASFSATHLASQSTNLISSASTAIPSNEVQYTTNPDGKRPKDPGKDETTTKTTTTDLSDSAREG